MKKAAKVLLISLLATSLVGCWDRRELEQRIAIVAFAVDVNEKNPNLVDVTIQIPIPIKIVGAGGGGSAPGGREAVKVITDTGRTVMDAFQNIQTRLNQQLFYGHTRVVIVSDKIAKSKDLADFIDILRRSPQIRRLLWPVVVPGRASQILFTDPKLEQIPIMYVMAMLDSGTKAKIIPDVTLGEFFNNLSDSSIEPVINLIEPTSKGFKWAGLAVFHGPKMIGRIDDSEVWAYMNLHDRKSGGDLLIPCFDDPGRYMTFHTRNVKTKVKVVKEDARIHVTYDVRAEGDIIESECEVDFNNEATINKIQDATKKTFEKRAKATIQHIQKDYKTDILGLGFIIRAKHPEIWKSVDWAKEFPKTKIDVVYHVNMRRFGMAMGKSRD